MLISVTIQVTRLHHWGPKRKCTFVCRYVAPPGQCYYNTIMLRLFFVECGIACFLCTMHVFKVWVSSSSPRLPLSQISFSFAASIVQLVHAEKSRSQSLHPANLMPRELKPSACGLEQTQAHVQLSAGSLNIRTGEAAVRPPKMLWGGYKSRYPSRRRVLGLL